MISKTIIFLFLLTFSSSALFTTNSENKYEHTFKTVCNSNLKFEFKFNNYLFSNTTNFNFIESGSNVVFLVDNIFKQIKEDLDITIVKSLYANKQFITFLFIGNTYNVNNVLKVNIILENCSNFRDIVQLSYKNDMNKIITDTFSPNKEGSFDISIPKFTHNSNQIYKFYFVDNVIFSSTILPLYLGICIILIFAFLS